MTDKNILIYVVYVLATSNLSMGLYTVKYTVLSYPILSYLSYYKVKVKRMSLIVYVTLHLQPHKHGYISLLTRYSSTLPVYNVLICTQRHAILYLRCLKIYQTKFKRLKVISLHVFSLPNRHQVSVICVYLLL